MIAPKNKGANNAMKQIRIGDVTIDAVIEREGPWRRPQDFFPTYDDAVFKHHLKTMEHAQILKELGCDILQGFLFGYPMDAKAFKAFAQSRKWLAAS